MTGPFSLGDFLVGANPRNSEREAHSAFGIILNGSGKFASHNPQILDIPNPNGRHVSSNRMEKGEQMRIQSSIEV
jgi:hypothetical protein